MSININVILGNNKILETIRLLQAAGRNKQLEKEANLKLEAKAKAATAARVAELAKQGLDANGESRDGSKKGKLPPEDKVTSYRGRGINILLVPDENQVYGPYGVLARTKKIKNLNFSDVGFFDGETPFKYDTFDLISFPGAADPPANAFAASSLPITVEDPTNVFNLSFIVTDNKFVQGVGSDLPAKVIIDGVEQAWVSSIKAKKLPIYTFEAYVRMGDGTDISLDEGSVEAQINISFMQTRIRFVLTGNFETYQRRWGMIVYDFDSYFELNPGFPDLVGSGVPDSGSEQGQWRHVAYVRDRTESRFYLDGVLSGSGNNLEADESAPIQGYIEITNGFGNGFVNSAFHGYRVTPKALYTEDFTPPPSITDFA